MEGLFLTITLSIAIPLLILLLCFFVNLIVVRRCAFGKSRLSENEEIAPCRLQEYDVERTAVSNSSCEPIFNSQQCSSDVHRYELSSLVEQTLQLPPYSTLPRNSTRPFIRDCSSDGQGTNSTRHGYRLSASNYSPFSQERSYNRTQTMQALSMYCDRYIADANYDPPPPYIPRESVHEYAHGLRVISETELVSFPPSHGCETWI